MKQELPKPVAIAIVIVLALAVGGFVFFKLNPPPARSVQELGGGGSVSPGQGGLTPIGPDGKPVEEGEKKGG
ncbi:MAG: hypothetical protein JSS66_17800 [Armatimonadetes bacterium]|nr:hypothetical protein [Armatimonadota bacterium]